MKTNFPYKTLIVITLCLLIFVVAMQGKPGLIFPWPYRSLAPFSGKVIDADTKEPISGAVVLAVYQMHEYGMMMSASYEVDAQETLTDENGEFQIPRKRRWFVLHRGYPDAKLIIFKPGYGVFPDHKRSEAVNASKIYPPKGSYTLFQIPKLKTRDERVKNLTPTFPDIEYEKKKEYIKLYNEERVNLGFGPTKIIPKGRHNEYK